MATAPATISIAKNVQKLVLVGTSEEFVLQQLAGGLNGRVHEGAVTGLREPIQGVPMNAQESFGGPGASGSETPGS